jgi:hypothetical protein
VQRDQRLAERRRVAGVEGGVPLPVLLAEAHHDDVGLLDQRPRPDGVDARPEMVVPERALLLAEDGGPGGIRGGVIGDRGGELDVETGLRGAALDPLTPVRVDLA